MNKNKLKEVIDTIVKTIRLEYSKDSITRTNTELHIVKSEASLSAKIKIAYVDEKIKAFIYVTKDCLPLILLKKYGSIANNTIMPDKITIWPGIYPRSIILKMKNNITPKIVNAPNISEVILLFFS